MVATRRPVARTASAVAPFEPLEGRQLFAASGLTLVETRSTLPVAQIAGATVKGNVTVQVTNGLTTAVSGPQTFNVLGSTTGTIDASSVTLGTVVRGNLRLGAGRTTKITVPVKVAAPPVGNYEIYIQATDAVGNTSIAGKAPNVSVAAPYTSLVAVVGPPRPTVALVNRAVTFKVTLTNNGNIDSTGTLSAAIEESTDGMAVTGTLGTPQKKNVKIKLGGKAVTLTYKAKLTDTGTFFLGATFTQGETTFTQFGTTPITVGTNAR